MPELPEVETVKNGLKNIYINKIIDNVIVNHNNIIANIEVDLFKEKLLNQTILSFDRYGKFIIVNLSNSTLLIHLRMEGKFKFHKDLIDKHSHVIFMFKDESVLIYHDVRKFGKIYYFEKDVDIFNQLPLLKLGKEPFEVNDATYLLEKLKKVKLPIKAALLDQSILAGIGNIYADEICFACKLSPFKVANTLTLDECKEIIKQSCIILNEAIKDGGSTIKTFQSSHGVDGLFQQKLKVYGKENQHCEVCNELIIKTFVKQRGTHYCPTCQKG